VPIASLAKVMTAYLTLHDHPLPVGAQGPELQISPADQAEAVAEATAGATNVPVVAGEKLSERQVLDGLLVHSANNLADVLARWDAGTVPAFVAKMNATAAAFGMRHTHYADASGLDPGTSGNPVDQLRATEAAMALPTFAAVVAQPVVTLPVAGALLNYVQSVGTDGIVGVKSGFTQAALGCLVLAGDRVVAGRPVLVLAAVTGQPGADPLHTANQVDVELIDAVASGLRSVDVVARGTRVATVGAPWSGRVAPAVATGTATMLAWPGQRVRVQVWPGALRPGLVADDRVGTVSVSVGDERDVVAVRLTRGVRGPSVGWRLARR
jgi:D-alanyl-D-alanine carboxypeptidase (penicillin-binding protein 5/6)